MNLNLFKTQYVIYFNKPHDYLIYGQILHKTSVFHNIDLVQMRRQKSLRKTLALNKKKMS